ncbi:MAG TPA: PaaI family thioesterase [Burkholderiaceae bacterium]|nr:PaaI family thioesterase [Burkholderiaceae bacterium]
MRSDHDHHDQPTIPDSLPPGFERHFKRSGLTDPWEPLFSRKLPDAVYIGLRAGPAHANSRGFVHGGLISALADNAMGLSCGVVRGGGPGSLVTVNLSVDFVSTARQGQWVEVRPTVVKVGGSMSFASALVYADDTVCARANATFRMVGA